MTCYVDALRDYGWKLRGRATPSCHLIADTLPELHRMAFAIGMHREWFQPESSPHYDLTPSRRALAIRAGAIELERRAFVAKLRELRTKDDTKTAKGPGAGGSSSEPAGESAAPPEVERRRQGGSP